MLHKKKKSILDKLLLCSILPQYYFVQISKSALQTNAYKYISQFWQQLRLT